MANLIADHPTFTAYDEEHFAVYLTVLHARADGVPDADIARDVLGLSADADPRVVQETIENHYQRALWLAENGAALPTGQTQRARRRRV
jgi:hypothetical protein